MLITFTEYRTTQYGYFRCPFHNHQSKVQLARLGFDETSRSQKQLVSGSSSYLLSDFLLEKIGVYSNSSSSSEESNWESPEQPPPPPLGGRTVGFEIQADGFSQSLSSSLPSEESRSTTSVLSLFDFPAADFLQTMIVVFYLVSMLVQAKVLVSLRHCLVALCIAYPRLVLSWISFGVLSEE